MYSSRFALFRDQLDDYNDRRERLIKAGRDITNASKKIIFLLHRVSSQNPPTGVSHSSDLEAALSARPGLTSIQQQYVAIGPDLVDFYRYDRQVSPGLQEYIEALSFSYYLEHNTLIPFDSVQATLLDESGNQLFPLSLSDYILGLRFANDLTGELMRYAISNLGRQGGRARAMQVCAFVRDCKASFGQFTPHLRGLRDKQRVTNQSLQKIEDAVYAIIVRTSEFDMPPAMLDDIVRKALASGSHRGATSQDREDGEEEYSESI